MAYWITRTDDGGRISRQDFQTLFAAESAFENDIKRANAWRFVTLKLSGESGVVREWTNPRHIASLEAARAEYIALSAADVRANPQAFKARVRWRR
ncbi:MAG: hypothetical protein AB7J28_15900 [Hyphomonadaceae bacterium]